MRYGYFDNNSREYVIDKIDVPFSMTNYIGVNDMCAVVNHTAGGYAFYKTPQYHRVTRFRPNGVPADRPGHYVYLRDNDTGEYFSISWQPVGLNPAKYSCRHGLSYSKYLCSYDGIDAQQTIFIPIDDPVLLWDVTVKNNGKKRNLSVFSYIEFSFHHIDMDNQNFQMSLYASGSSYDNGVIEYDLFYEEFGFQYFTSSFQPDGFDCLRDSFIGNYRTESNPIAVENGKCSSSFGKTGNHCGVLQKTLTLEPGEETRLVFILGQGNQGAGIAAKSKYSDFSYVTGCFDALKKYWDDKCSVLQIKTPDEGMNTSINIWNLYQAQVNILYSRFASFIEVGGRTGLGYRDTAQDAMCIPHAEPRKCRRRIIELMRGLTSEGYGLHLFDPSWFEPDKPKTKPFKSPTVVPEVKFENIIGNGLSDVCSDDALWLVSAVAEYIRETGETSLLEEWVTYADGGSGTVFEHLTKILDFSYAQRGETGICKGLRADWNDCLNLGGGESAMVSFLHYWALEHFIELSRYCGKDVGKYVEMASRTREICERELFDGSWYIRGITKNGRKIGTQSDKEGRIHLESNAWAVASGVSSGRRAEMALDSVERYLSTPYGIMLNAPSYTVPDDDIGFITRVYPGVKENGAIFSHSNPWVWMAEAKLGRGNKVMAYYDALLGYNQNDMQDIRMSEPYSYCQFIMGKDHALYGQARHPFMTGSAGWAYYSATKYILGIRPGFDSLTVDPCIPSGWDGFSVRRKWRGVLYDITVENPLHVQKGVAKILVNGNEVEKIPLFEQNTTQIVNVIMG